MRAIAQAVLLVAALICFVVAAVGLPATGGGRPVLTWMSAGLAFATLSVLVSSVRLRH
jgi:hypothetical protein